MIETIINEINESDKGIYTKEEIIRFLSKRMTKPVIESDGVVLNPTTYNIIINGNSQPLPKKVFEVVYLLMKYKNRILRRNEILNAIWGNDIIVGARTIDVHIRQLRSLNIPNIVTQKGVGYMWTEI